MKKDFAETGKRILHNVGEMACDFADTTRIRFKIANLESDVSMKTRKLGRLACDRMDAGELTIDEDMQKLYNEITDLKQRIASLKEDL